jgi:hypothetical protein
MSRTRVLFRSRTRRIVAPLVMVVAMTAPVSLFAAGPQFSGTYKVADVQPSGDSVHLTFSYVLRVHQPSPLAVEAVKLGNPSASDGAYADFPGGTIPAGGSLKGTQSVTVPKTVYKKWKSGQPAALFVKTTGDTGSAVWARVDAHAAGAVH